MPAASFDLTIEQGATFEMDVLWRDTLGVAVSLAGYTADMQIRQTLASSPILLELTTTNGRIVLNNPTGNVHLEVSATDTALIEWTSGVYDLNLTSPTGKVTRLLKGNVSADFEVTR